jgi:membrane-associated phospholipid phosphatase
MLLTPTSTARPDATPAVSPVRTRRPRLIAAGVAAALAVVVYAVSNLTALGQALENGLLFGIDMSRSAAYIPFEYLWMPPLRAEVPTLVIGLALVVVIAAVRRRWRELLVVAVAVPLSIGIDEVVARLLVRPVFDPHVPIWDLANSFPSGHVTIAASLASALLIVVPRGWLRWVAPIVIGWAALVSAAVLGFGWHRPSDVLGSVCLVAAVFLAASAAFVPVTRPIRRTGIPFAVTGVVVIVLAVAMAIQPTAWAIPIFAVTGIVAAAVTGVTALRGMRSEP